MAEEHIEEQNDSGTISRREFLKDAGLVVGGATVGSIAILSACEKTVTQTVSGPTITAAGGTTVSTVTITPAAQIVEVPVGGQPISFTLNGLAYADVVVDPTWDLQYFLHDVMGFIDIKTFCYRGACGSCTVIMNGRPILSCMTLAVDADGATIQTAQGIALAKHPLVDSYVKYHCMQCGYCTPGFICTAKALLDKNGSPSDDEIIEALSGNICRCGTYPQHVLAVKEAASVLKGGK